MNRLVSHVLTLFVLISILFTTAITPAWADDELYYSAAMCTPTSAGGFHNSGAEGFLFEQGEWRNYDQDDSEYLACPIPYDRDPNDLRPIRVRVSVNDQNNGTQGRITAWGFPTDGNGASAGIMGSDATSDSFIGRTTLELAIQPTEATRWLNLLLYVTDRDTQTGASAVTGYRVFR